MIQSFPADIASVAAVTDAFTRKLTEYKISEKLCMEYELLMEELVTKIVLSAEPNAEISIEVKRRQGAISAKVRCLGKPVVLESESGSDFSGQIITEYREYLRQSYSFGVNEIVFTTSFSSNETLLKNVISLGIAVVLGVLFRLFGNKELLLWVHDNVTYPVVLIFVRCMQTVAVPVAFFSLAAFVVNVRRTFDRNNKTIRLGFHYILSSVVAVAVGVLAWLSCRNTIELGVLGSYQIPADNFIGGSLKDFLNQVVSANMVEPFLISNPIPFLVNALILGLAASSVFGKSGDTIQNGLMAINDLFTRTMNLIYSAIPFFLFWAVLDLIFVADGSMLSMLGLSFGTICLAMVLLCLYYLVRLMLGRVSVADFFRKYAKLLLDNLKIASNIDSFPYNKRVLTRKMSLSRDYLAEGLKLGTLLNMDGNCLVVTVALCNMITAVGAEISPMKYIGMGIILLLFSVGAPNLPGSFLMGMIILMSFIGISSELIAFVLIIEALFSKFYSFLNAAGDIVTLAVEDERHKRLQASKLDN